MNPFTVDWSASAEEQLAEVWIQYPADAVAITKAQAAIDILLAKDPLGKGQQVSPEGLWKLTVAPLTVYYSVDQAAHIVDVDSVHYTP